MYYVKEMNGRLSLINLEDYRPATEVELTQMEQEKSNLEKRRMISRLKQELAETDYKALKYIDGALSEEEYAPVREQRQALRNQINELEAEIL